MKMTIEIKECPFCGGTDTHTESCYLQKMENHIKYLECCLTFFKNEAKLNHIPITDISDVYPDMLDQWNIRTQPNQMIDRAEVDKASRTMELLFLDDEANVNTCCNVIEELLNPKKEPSEKELGK
jgi:hypothetical protein